jgi:hypothetical protein
MVSEPAGRQILDRAVATPPCTRSGAGGTELRAPLEPRGPGHKAGAGRGADQLAHLTKTRPVSHDGPLRLDAFALPTTTKLTGIRLLLPARCEPSQWNRTPGTCVTSVDFFDLDLSGPRSGRATLPARISQLDPTERCQQSVCRPISSPHALAERCSDRSR